MHLAPWIALDGAHSVAIRASLRPRGLGIACLVAYDDDVAGTQAEGMPLNC